MALVSLVSFQLGRRSQSSSSFSKPGKKPDYPSVFVDMDDKPPMEIDFEAGIRANQRISDGMKTPTDPSLTNRD
jgi:hypothetical protein